MALLRERITGIVGTAALWAGGFKIGMSYSSSAVVVSAVAAMDNWRRGQANRLANSRLPILQLIAFVLPVDVGFVYPQPLGCRLGPSANIGHAHGSLDPQKTMYMLCL